MFLSARTKKCLEFFRRFKYRVGKSGASLVLSRDREKPPFQQIETVLQPGATPTPKDLRDIYRPVAQPEIGIGKARLTVSAAKLHGIT